MKITIVLGFFLPAPPVAGGATEKSWHGLALEFARRGHEVAILSRRWPTWPQSEIRDGVRHLRLPGYDHTGRLGRNLVRDLLWSLRCARALPPAAVTVANCVALPVLLGRRRGRAGRIVVMTGRMPKGQYRLYGGVDRVLAVSSAARAAVLAENPRLEDRIRVCGYPIPWASLSPPRAPRLPAEPLVFGYVGRIHREKGLDLLAAAFGELARRPNLPRWKIVLCGPQDEARGGSGPAYAERLRATLAAALPSGSWEILPPRFDRESLAALYRSLDVFCYPSLALGGETFGVAAAEAMAAGAVPVVSNLSCFADFVVSGQSGLVFEQARPDAALRLADSLAGLLADAPRRDRLAAAAQAAVRRYDFPSFADRLLEDFTLLVSTGNALA